MSDPCNYYELLWLSVTCILIKLALQGDDSAKPDVSATILHAQLSLLRQKQQLLAQKEESLQQKERVLEYLRDHLENKQEKLAQLQRTLYKHATREKVCTQSYYSQVA